MIKNKSQPTVIKEFLTVTVMVVILLLSVQAKSWLEVFQQPREAQAQTALNVALPANGATIRDISNYNANTPYVAQCRPQYPLSALNNGDRKGLNFGSSGVWSSCPDMEFTYFTPTLYGYQEIWVDFGQLRTINEVDLFTTQDNFNNPIEPTLGMTFSTEGVTDVTVSYWDPGATVWRPIPQATWTNDYHVWKKSTFPNITTSKIQVKAMASPSNHLRFTEIEAYQAPNSDHSDFGLFRMTPEFVVLGDGSHVIAAYNFMNSYAPNDFYPIKYTYNNLPPGMGFTLPAAPLYTGNDQFLHTEYCVTANCDYQYLYTVFLIDGIPTSGTYYFTMTATEMLDAAATRAPYTHTYTFRLDVIGADIKANGQGPTANIYSGDSAQIDWTSLTDPDPSGYIYTPSCNVDPTGWSGLSGSQSTGPLTTSHTYSVTCGLSWGSVSDSVTVNISPRAPATVTAQCATSNNGFYAASASPGAGVTCNLPASGQPGFIKWISTDSADGLCSVSYNGTLNDHLSTTSTSANPAAAVSTVGLSTPPTSYTFTITCASSSGGGSGSDTVTFTVPSASPYNLGQSAKHLIAVNQPNLSVTQLVAANVNPCDGQGKVVDPTYSFREGDVATFAINVCNTGGSDLVFNGSGDNTHAIVVTDILGNLRKPAAGWGAQVSCGSDCQIASIDESQPGRVIFTLQVKPGGNNRLIAQDGSWALFFNAVPTAPINNQPYFYLTTCSTNTTVYNAPAPNDVYNNSVGQPFDLPGLCLQALFSRGSNPPDRHEIAP